MAGYKTEKDYHSTLPLHFFVHLLIACIEIPEIGKTYRGSYGLIEEV